MINRDFFKKSKMIRGFLKPSNYLNYIIFIGITTYYYNFLSAIITLIILLIFGLIMSFILGKFL